MTGKTPNIVQDKITEETKISDNASSIHILALDNIKTRKVIVEKLEGKDVWIIDGRIGGWQNEIYTFNPLDGGKYLDYLKNLESEFSETECGEKCLWAVNSNISSIIIGRVIAICKSWTNVPFTEINRLDSKLRIIGEGI